MHVYPNYYKKKLLFFFTDYKNEWKQQKFQRQKNKKNIKPFYIDDIDVNKISVSKKEPYGEYNARKYFIGYNDKDVIRPLYLRLSQMTGYLKIFNNNKNKNKNRNKNKNNKNVTMSLKVKDKQLLKNYNKMWEKIDRLMRINFDSKPFYGSDDNKYIKTKIKTFKDKKKYLKKMYHINVYQ